MNGSLAFRHALEAARIFGIVASLLVKHVNRGELASLEYKTIVKGVELRMSLTQKMMSAISILSRFNAARDIAKAIESDLVKARELLEKVLELAKNGSIARAEKKLAETTLIIVKCGKAVNAIVFVFEWSWLWALGTWPSQLGLYP